jgi:hypothetical protein
VHNSRDHLILKLLVLCLYSGHGNTLLRFNKHFRVLETNLLKMPKSTDADLRYAHHNIRLYIRIVATFLAFISIVLDSAAATVCYSTHAEREDDHAACFSFMGLPSVSQQAVSYLYGRLISCSS